MTASWVPPTAPAAVEAVAGRAGRLVGIDAGGSATRGLVVESGVVVDAFSVEGMNALLTLDVVDRLCALGSRADATAVGVGMPGARAEAHTTQLGAEVEARLGCPVAVAPDVEVARLGAFLGRSGVVVVAGTGTVALGSDGRRHARAGGHGFLLGDEGGGYWMGREAVRMALRTADRDATSPLASSVATATGAPVEALVRKIHEHPTDRHLLARLAPVVTDLAAAGDPEAGDIAARAADHLADLARAVIARLGPLPVAPVGGVFASDVVRNRFTALTGAGAAIAAPTVGAVLLAARALDNRGYVRGE